MRKFTSLSQAFKDRTKRNIFITFVIAIFIIIVIGLFLVIDWKDEEPVILPIEEKKEIHEKEVEKIEHKIFVDSVNVWNADRKKRDSIRAKLNPR